MQSFCLVFSATSLSKICSFLNKTICTVTSFCFISTGTAMPSLTNLRSGKKIGISQDISTDPSNQFECTHRTHTWPNYEKCPWGFMAYNKAPRIQNARLITTRRAYETYHDQECICKTSLCMHNGHLVSMYTLWHVCIHVCIHVWASLSMLANMSCARVSMITLLRIYTCRDIPVHMQAQVWVQ